MTVGMFVSGAILLLLAALMGRAESNLTLTFALAVLGGVAVAGGIVSYVTRQERQNQRTNTKLLQLWQADKTLQACASESIKATNATSTKINELSRAQREADVLTVTDATQMIKNAQTGIDAKLAEISKSNEQAEKLLRHLSQSLVGDEGGIDFANQTYAASHVAARNKRKDRTIFSDQHRVDEIQVVRRSSKHTVRKLSLAIASNLPSYDFIELETSPLKLSLPVERCERADIQITVGAINGLVERRAGVLAVTAYDDQGERIDHRLLNSYSDKFGYFSYLAANGERNENRVSVSVPAQAHVLKLELHRWSGTVEVCNEVQIDVTEQNSSWAFQRKASDVKVAAILDEFSSNCFRYECDMISLLPDKWHEQLDDFQPDLFLCESAWSGADSERRPWKGRVYSSSNFKSENRKELLSILEYCKSRGIPTVFWNKEDPSHYDDKRHNFVDTALRFDHVFTTDLGSVNRYRKEYGHPSVHVLPFAVQPRLFNPIEIAERKKAVNFAGGWYSNHGARCEAMNRMFSAVNSSEYELQIFDRFYGGKDESHFYPEEFSSYIKPSVPNDRVAEVYKGSEIGMTINTETKSPTMFARRIFELMACNTYVVSNFSEGVHEFFGDDVLYLDRDPHGLKRLSSEQMKASKRRNLIKVLEKHTYRQRFEQILDTAKVAYRKHSSDGAVIVSTSSLDAGQRVFEGLSSLDNWKGPKVILLDKNIDNLAYADALTNWNRDGIRVVYEKLLLNGECAISELFDDSEFGVLVSSAEFLEMGLDTEVVGEMALHSQYIDLPIISEGSMTHESSEPRYRIVPTSAENSLLVSELSLSAVLAGRAKDKAVQAYSV
ncbi:hypothetical protein HMPREF2806_00030 [Corynebacterium sp. HMSC076G08]|nr:hypothetical protein HMPREF2806_00030 [Corynebacterium sp. HMSC076G08]